MNGWLPLVKQGFVAHRVLYYRCDAKLFLIRCQVFCKNITQWRIQDSIGGGGGEFLRASRTDIRKFMIFLGFLLLFCYKRRVSGNQEPPPVSVPVTHIKLEVVRTGVLLLFSVKSIIQKEAFIKFSLILFFST